ncbi:MAG TPA: ATP-binding protein, partial [Longimicrobiales bacterium]
LARCDAVRDAACARHDPAVTVPDVRLRHADGTWHWHQITYRMHYNADGRAMWATGIGVDVTERRLLEGRLREQNGALEDMVEELRVAEEEQRQLARFADENPSPVVRVRADGALLYANDPARRMLAGMGWREGDPVAGCLLGPATEAALAGAPLQREVVCPRGRVFSLVLAPSEADRTVNVYSLEITDRRAREQEVESLNARLRWAMSETHHRVKNNLQVIAAMVEVLAGEHDRAVPLHEIHTLSQHVRGLAAIHDLLTEQSRAGDISETVSVRAALRKLLPTLEATLSGRHIGVHVAEVSVPARQATALAIITNELVANAVKHGRGDIEVRLDVEDGVARLAVEDDGPGFPPGFDPVTAAHTGLDLVLMLARWDMQGSAEFGAAPGGGGRATVRFPVAATSPPAG